LTRLEIPAYLTEIGLFAFEGVRNLKLLRLGGRPLSWFVVCHLQGCLAPDAQVVGRCLTGRTFGHFAIVAA
jgi:hypothetical protein